jgi:heptosyltransferase II
VTGSLAYSPDILIVRFSAIGDILLTTPLIRALRARHPDAVISMLTKRQYSPLVSENPHLDEIIGITRKDSLFRIGTLIRRANYTHRLDLHGNLRTLVLKELAPGHWYSFSQRRVARYFLIHNKRNIYREDTPVAERYFEAAEDLDVLPDGGPPEFYLSAEAQERGGTWLSHAGIGHGRPFVAIAPGATHETKRWPVDHWVKLARLIIGTGADIVVLGGPDDSAIAGEIVARSGGRAASAAGLLGLQQTGAVLKQAAALISGDTGVMHMATALNVPVVALFGPTVRQFGFFPYNAIATVVERDIPCRPCTPHGGPACPLEHHYCMRQILPDTVMAALSRILS